MSVAETKDQSDTRRSVWSGGVHFVQPSAPCSKTAQSTRPFYRATLCVSAVFAVARCLSVRLSVSPSVHLSRWCIVSTRLKIPKKILVRPGSPIILVFDPSADTQFQGNPAQWWRKIHGVGKLRFLNEITDYLWNGMRQAHGCHGTLIGNHRWRIDPCRFRWP